MRHPLARRPLARHPLARTAVSFALAAVAALGVPADADESEGFYSACFGSVTVDLREIDPAEATRQRGTIRFEGSGGFDLLDNDTVLPHSDPHEASTVHITTHCWVQLGTDVPNRASADPRSHCVFESVAVAEVWAPGVFREDVDTGVAAGVCSVVFDVPPPPYALLTDTYLCAETTFSHDGVDKRFVYDRDRDPSNGEQCLLFYSWETG